jgi:hypothetical protein
VSDTQAKEILGKIKGDYERAYYSGILAERRAKAQLARGTPGCSHLAYEGFREAMHWFEKAEALRPSGNDDALLRWNTCARMMARNQLAPQEHEQVEPPLE